MTDAKVFVPKIIKRVIPRNRKSRVVVESVKPLYPGYIFIELGEFPWVDLVRVPYVVHIFRRSQWHPYMISKSRIVMERRVDESPFTFSVGDRVIITSGPFAGHKGRIVQEEKTEIVLFNRPLQISIPSTDLEKIPFLSFPDGGYSS